MLGAVLVLDQYPDAVVFTALAAVTTTLAGGLVGLLASTRSTPPYPPQLPAPAAPPIPAPGLDELPVTQLAFCAPAAAPPVSRARRSATWTTAPDTPSSRASWRTDRPAISCS